ncbi:MAG TPA: hypothetical protein VHP58_06905 [Alphaproteobacteria bacterium]|nr:hypothetical protein [Alphaproteobacteria bacterium]
MSLRKIKNKLAGSSNAPTHLHGDNCAACGPTFCGCHLMGLFCCKTMWLTALVAIVVVSGFQMIWHGTVMAGDYANSQVLWRPFGQMNMPLIYVANALTGLFFAMLFKLSYRGSGVVEGIKNGILIALPLTTTALIAHATQPIPVRIIELWIAGDILLGAVTGLVLAVVCRCCSKK